MNFYYETCLKCSKIFTSNYSTSFTIGIKTFDKKHRSAIYAIYALVRLGDEIVDTFYDFSQKKLLNQLKEEVFFAIENKISTNPIIHAFQQVVNQYGIENELITSFFYSMEMDLYKTTYTRQEYQTYIYGSAEVIGLMCLRVFCQNNNQQYHDLKKEARKFGEVLQKVNFLRDIKSDYDDRKRFYFPGITYEELNDEQKKIIEQEIEQDFEQAEAGIKKLPKSAYYGVLVAYRYYLKLMKKIKKTNAQTLKQKRFRINNLQKIMILFGILIQKKLGIRNL